ncbi:MAG: formate dehydrogenase accessory sulfurtransferase FdhD [Verrucomicrobia bacterium]|nr:MAG: formate dehydrogenase accessory sulfurtransferase FdhD [Verrucomicrobiota bacterium]
MTRATRNSESVASLEVIRYGSESEPLTHSDQLAREEPLEIRVRGRSVAVTMRTPGHDDELAAGFLLTEGIIQKRSDIIEIAPYGQSDVPENTLNVFLSPAIELDFERLTRHVFASSSCGICGKASIEAVRQRFPAADSSINISAKLASQLPEKMRAAQSAFEQTGGLHAAAIFDADGNVVVLREDVGRHNAVDKVIGRGLLTGKLPFDSHVLLVSGRASFEIVQKALAARIPIICAISAPSNLAVEFARENRQTLIGFLRGQTMNVYSGSERIT